MKPFSLLVWPSVPKSAPKAERVLRVLALAVLACAAVCYCICIELAGGGVLAFVLYLALTAVLVVLPGVVLATVLLPCVKGAGRAACGFALGVGLLAIMALCCPSGRGLRFALFLPLLFSLVLLAAKRFAQRKQVSAQTLPQARPEIHDSVPFSLLLLCFAGGIFVYSFSGVLAFAHAGAAGNMVYHQDMLWSVGNGAAAQFGFPLRDLRAAGGSLYYHYLSDALPGLLAAVGDLLPYDAAIFYNYPLLLGFLICAAYAAACAYGAKQRVAAIFPFALLFFQGFGSLNTLELLRNMNGVPAATLLACTLLFLVFSADSILKPALARQTERRASFWPALGFYCAYASVCGVLLMSKNLYAILIVCAVLTAAVVGSAVRRKFLTTPFCMAAVGGVMIALCWGLVFRHAINNLVPQLWLSPLALAKSLALWLPLGIALYAVSLVLSLRRFAALPVSRLVVNAAALGGILAYFLFNHYSGSQTYFILAAILFLWFCALDTVPLFDKCILCKRTLRKPLQWGAGILVVVSLVGTALSLLPVAQKGVQVALRCVGLRPEYPTEEETVTPGDEEAALWLRAHMLPEDVFATNRNARSAEIGEGTWHYYSAMSGRQAFVESWRYAMDYGFDYHALRYNLEQVSDVIFAQESAEAAFALAKENGIRYLLVSLPRRPTPFLGANPVFENSAVRIYEVV